MQRVTEIMQAVRGLGQAEGYLFDMDGLIFDTERTFMEQLAVVMKEHGYHLTREIYEQTLGLAGERLKEVMQHYFGEDYPVREMGHLARERHDIVASTVGLTVKPEIPEVLEYLQKKKIPCAVASSSRTEYVMRYLELAGLTSYFSVIIGGEQVAKSKPSPDIFLLAAQKLGCLPAGCVVLEDSENGIRAAHAAGMRAICVPDLKMPCDKVLEMASYVCVRPQR